MDNDKEIEIEIVEEAVQSKSDDETNKAKLEDNNESKKQEIFNQLQSQGLFPTDLTIKKTNETSRKIIFPGAIMYFKEKRESS